MIDSQSTGLTIVHIESYHFFTDGAPTQYVGTFYLNNQLHFNHHGIFARV